MTQLDPRALRDAFGSFMTGVTVVTALGPDKTPVGFTANSFTSVSLDPPLLLVCPGQYLSSFAAFQSCKHFSVSVLAEGQEDISNTFAGFKGDRFAKTTHRLDLHGVPLIEGAVATFSCKTAQTLPAGDHAILIGEVTAFSCTPKRGLGYVGGRYFSLGLERGDARPDHTRFAGLILENDGCVLLENSGEGLHPPAVAVPEGSRMRDTVAKHLADRSAKAALHHVYSSFDDTESGRNLTYFLASATTRPTPDAGEWVPIENLAGQNYASPAIATMMRRYALEAQTQNFTLYLGDADDGDTYTLPQRT